jgi:mRNA interferase MazF
MPRLQQGSVVWADLPGSSGRRPVVVLTRDSVIGRMNRITVAPITRTMRGINTEVRLEPADGVPTVCAVSLDNIITIDRPWIRQPITTLDRGKLVKIFDAIRAAFEMP